MSDLLLNEFLLTRQRVDQLERIEQGGGAYLTLTRTSTVSIGSAGAIVTWQSEIRSRSITWSGSAITIPSDGYYLIDVAGDWGSGGAQTFARVYVGGVAVERMTNHYQPSINEFRVMAMRYFSASDSLEIQLVNPGGSRSLQITSYNAASNSPFLHIVKL
jgi:hypothetical protein